MRLIARRVYRAFPELDTFDDAQCQRFIVAANAAHWKVVLRFLAILIVGGVLSVLAIPAAVVVAASVGKWAGLDRVDGGEKVEFALIGVCMIVLLVIAWTGGLITRDILLRWGVRSIIRRCGQCWNCHYNLLGMTVSAESTITCPECGSVTTADASLGELSRDGNTVVYRPTAHRDHAEAAAARRAKRRKLVKRAGIVLGSGLLIMLVVGGSIAGVLAYQASLARADLDVRDAVATVRASLRDGSVSDAEATRRWERMVGIVSPVSDLVGGRSAIDRRPASGVFAPSTLEASPDKVNYGKGGYGGVGPDIFDRDRAFTLWVMNEARTDGTLERLRELPDLVGGTMPRPQGGRVGWISAWIPEMQHLYAAVSLQIGVMEESLVAGDLPAYLRAMTIIGAARDILRQQGADDFGLTRQLDARLAVHAASYPSPDWHDAVLAARLKMLGTAESRAKVDAAITEIGRLSCRAWVAGFYAKMVNPLMNTVGLGVDDYTAVGGMGITSMVKPEWPGLYTTNRDAVERLFAQTKRELRLPLNRRSAGQPRTGLPLVDMITQYNPRMHTMRLQYTSDTQRALLELYIHRFHRINGTLPAKIEDALLPEMDPAILIDPITNNRFAFASAEETTKAGKLFLLSSLTPPAPPAPALPAVPVDAASSSPAAPASGAD